MDDGDPLVGSWILAWNAHQAVRAPWNLFSSNSFYPYQDSLAFSEHMILPAMLAAPFFYAGGNALVAYNLAVLLTLALSAFGMYLLVKEVLGSADVALAAGMIYGFQTYSFHEAARIQIVSLHWWPLALLHLNRLFQGERPRKSAFLFGLFFLLQALSCTYYLFYFGLALAIWVPVYAWVSEGGWSKLRHLLLPGLAVASVLLLFALPYQRVVERFDFHRELSDGLDAIDYLRPYERSLMARALSSGVEPSTVPHYLGVLPLFLALLGVFSAPRGRAARTFFRLCIVTASLGFILSLGAKVVVDGRELGPGVYGLLHAYLPGFRFLQSPDRLSVLLQFGIAVIAAWGAGTFATRLSPWKASFFRMGLLVLLPLEHLSLQRFTEIPTGSAVPAVYRWLASQPEKDAVVELPLYPREQLRIHSLYMFYSTYHWKPVVFGRTSYYPPLVGYLAWELRRFPSADTLSLLRRVGVSRVIVRPSLWEEDERNEKLALFETFRSELVYEEQFPELAGAAPARYGFGGESVYRLRAPERPAEVPEPLCLPEGEIDPSPWRIKGGGETPAHWAIDRNRRTKWRSQGQAPGTGLEIDFGREETVAALRLAVAHPYDEFPRDPTIEVWSTRSGRFEPVVHREDLATRLEVLEALLDRPADAALTLRFPPVGTRWIRVRVREGKELDASLPDWSLPELHAYRSCAAASGDK